MPTLGLRLSARQTTAAEPVDIELARARARISALEDLVARQDDELRFLRQLAIGIRGPKGELMGRPLTGLAPLPPGPWWASLPAAKGRLSRREEGFASEDDARAWLAQAVAALQATAVPSPARSGSAPTSRPARRPAPARPEPPKLQPDVASVAKAWMAAAYEDLRRGGPERAERVRRIVEGYLVPWFAPRPRPSPTSATSWRTSGCSTWSAVTSEARPSAGRPGGRRRQGRHREDGGEVGLAEAARGLPG